MAGTIQASPEVPMSREAQIMNTATAEIAKRESWPMGADFSVETNPKGGWRITATKVRSAKNGRIKLAKERRVIIFDVNGTMTDYRTAK